jgi:ubiquinone/menaquinone biosynthesis C-methylase UbiE
MIYQYTKGHRFTTDDICTAYFAHNEMKDAITANRAQNSTQNIAQNRDNTISGLSPPPSSSQPSSHLDLGCGMGSVLLMLKWNFGDSIKQSIGMEAQGANLELGRRSAAYNGLEVSTARCSSCTMLPWSEGS